jgi:hypothetical protein
VKLPGGRAPVWIEGSGELRIGKGATSLSFLLRLPVVALRMPVAGDIGALLVADALDGRK